MYDDEVYAMPRDLMDRIHKDMQTNAPIRVSKYTVIRGKQIKKVIPVLWNDVDSHIMKCLDPDKKRQLRMLYEDRKKMRRNTKNWEHLENIWQDKYGQ